MVDVGGKIKYIRETYDVTQIELGEYLNLSKSSISHYEKNDRDIPMRKLSKISNFFNFSIDYILGLTSIKTYPDLKKEIHLKTAGKRLQEICEDLKYSNVKLAKELNTTESTIRKYKSGQTLILTAFALQLNQKYNYSINWIIEKTENKKSQRKTKDFKLSLLFFYNLNKLYTTPL